MLNFACVYYGDKYSVDYVRILYNMVQRNTKVAFKFICFTDSTSIHRTLTSKNIEFRQFKRHDFQGWFNKLQLFSPDSGLVGNTLYMDLDIVILKNIDDFFLIGKDKNFVGMNDFNPTTKIFNSSIMKFNNETASKMIWEPYMKRRGDFKRHHGDQNIISELLKGQPDVISFPDEWTQSYKWLNRKGERYGRDRMTYEKDPNAKVCVFHGRPNPHESTQLWVKNHWY
jgi:hypothetical protein|tara:strand:- start:305 stop:985 length:681 start_codon:yes stop_codon:yes gene_type:complete